MTRLLFSKIHSCKIFTNCLSFFSDIQDGETSFFYTKNKYRFGQFLVTLLFFWGEEKYNHKSQSFRMIWGTRDFYTQSFTKIDFEIRLCWSSGTNNLECSIIRARSTLRTMGTGLTIHGFIITGRRVFLCLMSLLCLLCLRLL